MYKKYSSLGNNNDNHSDLSAYVVKIKDLQHKNSIIQNTTMVIVDVYADWCQPCKLIAPKYSSLAKSYSKPGFCLFCKEDVELELSPDVTGVPTFLFYYKGELVNSQVGADMTEFEQNLQILFSKLNTSNNMNTNQNPLKKSSSNIKRY